MPPYASGYRKAAVPRRRAGRRARKGLRKTRTRTARKYVGKIRRRFTRKAKTRVSRTFVKKVRKALDKVGSLNFSGATDQFYLAPYVGYPAVSATAFTGGSWKNQSLSLNNMAFFEVTGKIPYDPAPAYNLRDITRTSNKIRIKYIEVFGMPTITLDANSAALNGDLYVDYRPYICWPNRGTDWNPISQQQTDLTEVSRVVADRIGKPFDFTQQDMRPETVVALWPHNLKPGKHAFSVKHGNWQRVQGPILHGETNNNAVQPAVQVIRVPDQIGPAANYNMNYCHWRINVDKEYEYPTSVNEDEDGSVYSITPLYMGWEGKPSQALSSGMLATIQNYSLGSWGHFHWFVYFEDLFSTTY